MSGHPHTPDVIPEPPEHVEPTGPDGFEAFIGVIYCIRCGRPIRTVDGAPMVGADKPCSRVKVELRYGPPHLEVVDPS